MFCGMNCSIDPERAAEIHPHDLYRIQRALYVSEATGIKPSLQKPQYNPVAPYLFLFLTRNRADLYARINDRVVAMMNAGWIEETKSLLNVRGKISW